MIGTCSKSLFELWASRCICCVSSWLSFLLLRITCVIHLPHLEYNANTCPQSSMRWSFLFLPNMSGFASHRTSPILREIIFIEQQVRTSRTDWLRCHSTISSWLIRTDSSIWCQLLGCWRPIFENQFTSPSFFPLPIHSVIRRVVTSLLRYVYFVLGTSVGDIREDCDWVHGELFLERVQGDVLSFWEMMCWRCCLWNELHVPNMDC